MVVKTCALIFAKFPQPRAVNTRMVPPLSFDEAAAVHRASLIATCENVVETTGLDVTLVVTPDERVDDLRRLIEDRVRDCWPQGDGDLGARLSRATDRAFASGARGVLLLGADSPTLPPDYLREAVAGLSEHDVVLGPCEDGGYYLLGLRRSWPALFKRIDWGGPHVARQTGERAAGRGIDLIELSLWYDLDRFDDLVRAARDLEPVTGDVQPAMIALKRVIKRCVSSARV